MACKVNLRHNESVCKAIIEGLHKEKNITGVNSEIQNHVNDALSWRNPIDDRLHDLCDVSRRLVGRNGCRSPFHPTSVVRTIPDDEHGLLRLHLDVSTPKTCIIRIATLQVCVHVSKPIGMALCGLLSQTIDFTSSMLVCLILLMLALFYGIFALKEKNDIITSDLLKDLINLDHVAETLKLLTKSQPINMLYILTLNFIVNLVFAGEGNVYFWFVQQAFSWTNTEFAYFQSARSVGNCLALTIVIHMFSKVLRLDNLAIIMISLADKVLSNTVCGMVKTPFGLYASNTQHFDCTNTYRIRAQSTKYVSEKDVGKMQSLLSLAEAMATCLSVQIYNQGVYALTKDSYEQAFLHLGSVLFAIVFVLTACKYYLESNENNKILTPIAERPVE
ncbi:hypothetical protein FQR65_LT05035 [Abscondita terminalis]|nr:hypothetical protein FQR65_LT05035 [Abscondita terminalis]